MCFRLQIAVCVLVACLLEEYSHASAPEVFLAACSQRTKNIQLGQGIRQVILQYNHPARTAKVIATLDLV